mmetsp:Transcript_6226/g.13567  ORF Transcript_6226/g.13567 Transcript_6226/m.13567 type:complete len:140 (+) Transcript_6226:407-826(+)
MSGRHAVNTRSLCSRGKKRCRHYPKDQDRAHHHLLLLDPSLLLVPALPLRHKSEQGSKPCTVVSQSRLSVDETNYMYRYFAPRTTFVCLSHQPNESTNIAKYKKTKQTKKTSVSISKHSLNHPPPRCNGSWHNYSLDRE